MGGERTPRSRHDAGQRCPLHPIYSSSSRRRREPDLPLSVTTITSGLAYPIAVRERQAEAELQESLFLTAATAMTRRMELTSSAPQRDDAKGQGKWLPR